MVQTDNNSVMSVLRGEARRYIRRLERRRRSISYSDLHFEVLRRNEEIDEISRTYLRLVEELQVTVIWRHCKGHRGQEDRRAAVNTYCDQRAYERMKEARRELARGAILKAA